MRWTTSAPEFVFPAHVYSRELDGQMVLLNLMDEQYFGLDEIGTDIVSRLVSKPSASALDELIERYNIDRVTLKRDITELVAELVTAGLLEQSGWEE
jgi:predicted transcriptional regulator